MFAHFIKSQRFRQPWGKGLMKVLLQIKNGIDILQIMTWLQSRLLGGKPVLPLIAALVEQGTTTRFMQAGQAALVNRPVTQVIVA